MTIDSHNRQRCLVACSGALHLGGGIAGVARLMLRALADAGCYVDVFALHENNASIDSRYVPPDQVSYQVYHGSKPRFALAVWRTLLAHRFDYVFVDHINLASMLSPWQRLSRLQYNVWLYGLEVFPPRPDREGRLGLTHAAKCLAISEYTRSRVAEQFPQAPITVCELALDPILSVGESGGQPVVLGPMRLTAVSGVTAELGSRVILHVGRMASSERYKGQDVLLRSFPALHAGFPDAQLVLAGQGDDHPRLLALARSLPNGVQSAVFMPGYVPDAELDQLYRGCYVFAMPSSNEGFGLVYLEAMARSKPCVGGKIDATPYVVRDGMTGVLVDDPREPGEVTAALALLLSQPERAAAMGRAGHELVQSHYLYEHFRQRFWRALDQTQAIHATEGEAPAPSRVDHVS